METFVLSDLLAESDCEKISFIRIGSAGLGTSVTVEDAQEIRSILDASAQLTGTNPISSRGYYGGNYRLDFCDGDGNVLLSFLTWISPTATLDAAVTLYTVNGEEYLYETVSTHSYSPMYTVDADVLTALNDLCKSCFSQT